MRIDIAGYEDTTRKKNTFLSEVYVLDFDDDYHRTDAEPSSELERRVRNLKRRYKNMILYSEALATYYEYMDFLYTLHGSKELFDLKFKSGVIEEYVPHKPKLKETRVLKFYYDNNIVIGRGYDSNIDMDKADEFLSRNADFFYNHIKDDEPKFVKSSKEDSKKISKYIDDECMDKDRPVSGIDFLDEYFQMKNKRAAKDLRKRRKKYNQETSLGVSLTQIWKYADDDGNLPEGIEDTSDDDKWTYFEGVMVTRANAKDMELYKRLAECGWNSYAVMKRNKSTKRAAKSILKEEKKNKKKEKKKNKLINAVLSDIASDNGYEDYEDFCRDMEDFSYANVMTI